MSRRTNHQTRKQTTERHSRRHWWIDIALRLAGISCLRKRIKVLCAARGHVESRETPSETIDSMRVYETRGVDICGGGVAVGLAVG